MKSKMKRTRKFEGRVRPWVEQKQLTGRLALKKHTIEYVGVRSILILLAVKRGNR